MVQTVGTLAKNVASAWQKRCRMFVHRLSRSGKRTETKITDRELVLIVNDDDMVRRCLVRLIHARGCTVAEYSSDEEFLVAQQAVEPICLLLDATLPGMSGLELQRRLADERRRLPIIFMSAHDEPIVREKALQAGAITFLLKPFRCEALFNAVKSVSETSGEGMSLHDDEAGAFAEQEVRAQGGHHASRKVERPGSRE